MEDCMQAAGAEHMRGFAGKLAYSDQRWTQLLIPYYCSHYSDDDGRCHPVFINGQTGAIRGLRLASQRKGWKWAGILAAAALLLFVLALVCFALGALFPPAAFIGAGLALLALLLGAGALVPALWPWQWNRRQKGIGVRELG